MKLRELCKNMNFTVLQGDTDIEIKDIKYDSRTVSKGAVFICLVGSKTDGHYYIEEAISSGATAIIIEKEVFSTIEIPKAITIIKTESCRHALAVMSAAFFGYPAQKLTTIGVTGTKGKTTTAHMIKKILETSGKKTGMIGTIGVSIGDTEYETPNTTPESYELHKIMAEMIKSGCEYMVMEVSSQGIKLERTAGIIFDYGIFLNLSHDHIGPGEHADFAEYMKCKSRLFHQCKTGIINIDDPHANNMIADANCHIITFSTKSNADLYIESYEIYKNNGKFGMKFRAGNEFIVSVPGKFSVYNAAAAIAVCRSLGIEDEDIKNALSDIHVKGRVEQIEVYGEFNLIIDFAHNGVSMKSVLETLRQYCTGRLICIFGAGGNRSRDRRFDMGEAAGRLADLSILTEDNPRSEKISDINADIITGIKRYGGNYLEIENRKEAIEYGMTHANPGDIVILLGKGHEPYIERSDGKEPYSEYETVQCICEKMNNI